MHPRYLDAKGLVALWREGLLAQAVLKGETQGYKHHPQLTRFKNAKQPLAALTAYLWEVQQEAVRRGYKFDPRKLGRKRKVPKIPVTRGQLAYEWKHLKKKLWRRDRQAYRRAMKAGVPKPHASFRVVPGGIEDWEVTD